MPPHSRISALHDGDSTVGPYDAVIFSDLEPLTTRWDALDDIAYRANDVLEQQGWHGLVMAPRVFVRQSDATIIATTPIISGTRREVLCRDIPQLVVNAEAPVAAGVLIAGGPTDGKALIMLVAVAADGHECSLTSEVEAIASGTASVPALTGREDGPQPGWIAHGLRAALGRYTNAASDQTPDLVPRVRLYKFTDPWRAAQVPDFRIDGDDEAGVVAAIIPFADGVCAVISDSRDDEIYYEAQMVNRGAHRVALSNEDAGTLLRGHGLRMFPGMPQTQRVLEGRR